METLEETCGLTLVPPSLVTGHVMRAALSRSVGWTVLKFVKTKVYSSGISSVYNKRPPWRTNVL